jgi:hypothetical protein
MLLTFLKQYVGCLIGVVLGSTIGTLVTVALYGDLPGTNTEAFKQCLIENASNI